MKNNGKMEYNGSLLYQRMAKENQLRQSEHELVEVVLVRVVLMSILIFSPLFVFLIMFALG
ncbi:hypothetical protein K6976_04340 [Streptococcus suis]|uniref:hypothetical protein n=1 Tax=Streptococcus suis TaxID=1307 RepID=UPI001C9CCA62|nr:hypothetical protein [Streptococcus suis]QZS51621.1 hypothetical protein K6976_02055 [Streptococcus suis]QZS52031.1 hypothetical protein K6976_04340 [Streptococcus suis]HEM3522881.1 hypothetical protein [Streptococcus suis]